MDKKYELTDETIEENGVILHRIKALKNFGTIEIGDLGGFIECENNLSHSGNCWVYYHAKVYDNAMVYGNAKVYDNAIVYGKSEVYDYAEVFGGSKVYDHANIFGNCRICGNVHVYNHARIFGTAKVSGSARVFNNAEIYGNTKIDGRTEITKSISDSNAYISIGPIGSRNDFTTFIKTEEGTIHVNCGCFSGSIDKFKDKVIETHGDNKHARNYLDICKFVEIKFNL